MIFDIEPMLTLSAPWAALLFTTFLRIGAAMAFLPAFAEQVVPVRIRLALALALTALVAPLVPIFQFPTTATQWVGLGLQETVIGLAMGFLFRLFVLALQIAGAIAAASTSLSQMMAPTVAPDPSPALGAAFLFGGLALATSTGLHLRLVEGLTLSYEVLPVGVPVLPGALAEVGVSRVAQAFGLAFTLAAPFTVAALLYNLALGVINRAMPQLMVAFVGAPALTLGGLVLLALTLPGALLYWVGQFMAARPLLDLGS